MLAALGCRLAAPVRRASDRPFLPLLIPLAAYVAAAAAALAGHWSEAGAFKLVGIASLAATTWLTADLAGGEPGRRRVLAVVAFSALGVCGAAWLGVALATLGTVTPLLGGYGDLVPGEYVRVRATLGHPNLLASYLIFAWTAVAAHPAAPWRRPILAAIAVTMPLTLSRGLLAFVLAILLGGAVSRGRRIVAGAWAAATLAALTALTVWNLEIDPTRFWEARVRETPGPRREALAKAAAHPWTGCGPSCRPATVQGFPYDAHCTPVNVAATLGLPALLALATLVALCWRRSRPTDRILWAGLAGIIIDGLTQDVEDFRHLWVLFGLLAPVSPSARHDSGGASSPSPGGSIA